MRQVPRVCVVAMCIALGACGSSARNSVTPSTTTERISTSTSTRATSSSEVTTSTNAPVTTAPEISPSGDIPDNQAFVAYAPPGGPYSIEVPEGWARTNVAGVTMFSDHFNSIRISGARRAVARSVATARTIDVPALQGSERGFVLRDVTEVTRRAGRVVLITFRSQSVADPVTGKRVLLDGERYEFWRNGTAVTVTLSAPTGSDNVDPWKRVTDSFTWTI